MWVPIREFASQLPRCVTRNTAVKAVMPKKVDGNDVDNPRLLKHKFEDDGKPTSDSDSDSDWSASVQEHLELISCICLFPFYETLALCSF
jgi:hypothetical protein